jgi:hypothetical protein
MEIKFADSFSKSLKKLVWHHHPVYKFYELFRYKLPSFFKNVWFFRKELWQFRTWDYTFNLLLLKRSIEGLADTIEFKGWEIDESRLKKVAKMKRAIQILDNIENYSYIEMAEEKLGKLKDWKPEFKALPDNPELFELVDNENEEEKSHTRAVYVLSDQLEQDEWNELWTILRGQNIQEYKDQMDEKEVKDGSEWDKWHDGSDMRQWWD